MRVTAAVHRFINYVKQYEKCDPAAGQIPLSVPLLAGNREPDNLSYDLLRHGCVNGRTCSAGYDLRIVFDFVKAEKDTEDDIFLLAIGTHDEVY